MFLEYGVNQHNELVHIAQAKSGIVDLFCPYCGVGLIARKGQIKVHHFAHNGETCRDVAERDENAFVLPYYDKFDLGLNAEDIYYLKYIADMDVDISIVKRERGESLQRRGFIKYNEFARNGRGDYELTPLGGIPIGKTTLKAFAEFQQERLMKRHEEFVQVVVRKWRAVQTDIRIHKVPNFWKDRNPDQLEILQAPLADLHIYRAQLRRVLSAKLYFLEIASLSTGSTFYKVGMTSRELSDRIAEVERDLFPHFGKVSIKPLRTLANRGSIEFYFKHRYHDNQTPLGSLTEYFTFDNRKNVLSDLSKLGDYEPDEIEHGIIAGLPSPIEIEMLEEAETERQRLEREAQQAAHQQATIAGMQRAREKGIHVGRPAASNAEVLAQYPEIVAALQQGIELRAIARDLGVSRNTVRKVQAAVKGDTLS